LGCGRLYAPRAGCDRAWQARTTHAVSVGRRKKPFAFIEFLDYKDAQDAKEDWDRREFFGRVIEVVFAQQKRPSLANPFLKRTHACTHTP
jgi:hypothetical protein